MAIVLVGRDAPGVAHGLLQYAESLLARMPTAGLPLRPGQERAMGHVKPKAVAQR